MSQSTTYPLVSALGGFAPARLVISQTRNLDISVAEWRGGYLGQNDLHCAVVCSDLGMGDIPWSFWFDYLEYQGGNNWRAGARAVKLLTDVEGPKPPSPKGGLPVLRFEAVKIFQASALEVTPSVFPKVGPGLGTAWAEPGESLTLWRKQAEEGAASRLKALQAGNVPKEIRLLLASVPATCGTEPRLLLSWCKAERTRLRAEKKQGAATKKGARRTGLGACTATEVGGMSLTEIRTAERYLRALVRTCRLTARDRERAAKARARAKQAATEQAWQNLWKAAQESPVGGEGSIFLQGGIALGQTTGQHVWTGRAHREKVYA